MGGRERDHCSLLRRRGTQACESLFPSCSAPPPWARWRSRRPPPPLLRQALQGPLRWPTTLSCSRARCLTRCRRSTASATATTCRRSRRACASSSRRSPPSPTTRKPPTFDNTIVALERSGRLLRPGRAHLLESQRLQHRSARCRRSTPRWRRRLTAQRRRDLPRSGAVGARRRALPAARQPASRSRVAAAADALPHAVRARRRAARRADTGAAAELNEQISSLTTRFKQNVLKATADGAVVVDSVARARRTVGRSRSARRREAAAARGLKGKWLITLQNTTNQPVLAHLTNRALRERIYKASISARPRWRDRQHAR